MLHFTYPVKLTRDRKDGGYVVSCRDIPEAVTQGDSMEQALSEAEGALQASVESRIEDGLDIPAPSRATRDERMVPTPITTALKAAVYNETRGQKVSKSELARRMHVNEKKRGACLIHDIRHGCRLLSVRWRCWGGGQKSR